MLNWCTDLHLERAEPALKAAFYKKLAALTEPLVISGDISDATHLPKHLHELKEVLKVPLYFVLGNHDYWGSSIATVRSSLKKENYLPFLEPIALTKNSVLIGHDGWADGRVGDFLTTTVVLNDFHFINDFKAQDKPQQLKHIQQLADEAATFVEKRLNTLFSTYEEVVLITHIPPFPEAALYKQKHSDPSWSCYMVCVAMGHVLKKAMSNNPTKTCTVLCGHSHHKADLKILPNLRVVVGEALYGAPTLQPPLKLR